MRNKNDRISIRTLDTYFCIIDVWNGLFERLFEWKRGIKMTVNEAIKLLTYGTEYEIKGADMRGEQDD